MHGQAAVVELLLKAGANKEAMGEVRAPRQAHVRGLRAGHGQAAAWLAGAAPRPRSLAAQHRRRHAAVSRGSLRLPRAAQLKRTPLHYAAEKGHAAVVEELLKAGANKEAHDEVRAPLRARAWGLWAGHGRVAAWLAGAAPRPLSAAAQHRRRHAAAGRVSPRPPRAA